jgi:hypothetical protein
MRNVVWSVERCLLGDKGALAQFEADLPAEPDRERDGWLAAEYVRPELFDSRTIGPIVAGLALMPPDWFVSRLVSRDFVDSALAELLVLAGLTLRHRGNVEYEKETDAGKCPDLSVSDLPITYEVRLLEEWQPSVDRARIRGRVQNDLSVRRIRAVVTLKFSDMLTFSDAEVTALVARLVHEISALLPAGGETRVDLRRALPQKAFDGTGNPSIQITAQAGSTVEVSAERPNVIALTGQRAAARAQADNAQSRTVAYQPSGSTLPDYVRRTVKKKTKQLPGDRSGVIVLVSRLDLEPHVIDWAPVLAGVLDEEQLLVADRNGPFRMLGVKDSVVSPTLNTRLAAVLGLTIDAYGHVARSGGRTNAHVKIPEPVQRLATSLATRRRDPTKDIGDVLTVDDCCANVRYRVRRTIGSVAWNLRVKRHPSPP